jgi:hypothetical protein
MNGLPFANGEAIHEDILAIEEYTIIHEWRDI